MANTITSAAATTSAIVGSACKAPVMPARFALGRAFALQV
jgi:hypothetical protein